MRRASFCIHVRRSAVLAVASAALALGATGCTSRVGMFLPFVTGAVGTKEITTEARALGVRTARFSQDVTAPIRPNFAVFERNGIGLVVDLHNDPQPNANGHNVSTPPETPEEVATWRQQVATFLDGVAKPVALQVENEENSTTFFQGRMSDYVNQLNATVEAAHARGVKVTNGGITSDPTALLTWQDYKDRGMDAEADDFAARVFADKPQVLRDLRANPFAGLRNASLQGAWDRAKELIPAYRKSGMDYVNFHWYDNNDEALSEAILYLRRATGKPVVTTEIGQHNDDPAVVSGHLTTVVEQLRLPLVIWFDADGMPAIGLHDQPGELRPNGITFRDYLTNHAKLVN